MKCPYCNQEHPDDSQFCPNTGKMIAPATSVRTRSSSGSPSRRLPVIAWVGIILGVLCILLAGAAVAGLVTWKVITRTGVASTAAPGTVAQPAPSGKAGGRIAFVSDRDGHSEIYVMNADGSQQTRLTNTAQEAHNDFPAWSPDGQKIAFVSDRGGNTEIYVMNADGSEPTLLMDIPAETYPSYNAPGDFVPAWSPDGQKLAFMSSLEGEYEVCIMNADGSNPGCLPNSQVGDLYLSMLLDQNWTATDNDQTGVSWCGDGITIVYSSIRSGNPRIYAINTVDGAQASLSSEGADFAPDCSADGQKIAFVSTRRYPAQIYMMNSDGSDQTALTHETKGSSLSPSWSADGGWIVFQSDRDGNAEIYVMEADGSRLSRLTNNPAQDWHPDWSPVNLAPITP
jgi:Tol biopolymer transport system component